MSNSLQIIDTINNPDSSADNSQLYSALTHFDTSINNYSPSDNTVVADTLPEQTDSTFVTDSLILSSNKQDSIKSNKSDSIKNSNISIDLSKDNLIIKERNVLSNDWLIGVLLFLVLSVGWIRLKYGKLLVTPFKAAFNSRLAHRLHNEEGSIQKKVSFFLNFIYILGIGLFITEAVQFYNIRIYGLSMFNVFWIVSIIFLILVYFKNMAYKFMAALYNVRNEISEYLYSGYILNKVLSFLMLPLIITIPFASYNLSLAFIYIGIATFTVFYLLQLFRGIQVIIKYKRSIIYSFLYFFAFEIVPILILFKFAQSIL